MVNMSYNWTFERELLNIFYYIKTLRDWTQVTKTLDSPLPKT